MSSTLDTYRFACEHQYSIQSTNFDHANRPHNACVTYGGLQLSRNICFKCYATECEEKIAKEAKEKAVRKCEEACAAHKAHYEFLKLQMEGAKEKNNIELYKVLEKMSGETQKLWYMKREEYMTNYLVKKTGQTSHSEIFQKEMNRVQDMIDYMRDMAMRVKVSTKAWSSLGQYHELAARRVILDRLAKEYKELKRTYEEFNKKGFEDITMKLEKLRIEAAELM